MKQYFNFSWCFFLCLLAMGYTVKAQEIRVEAKLDQTKIKLGDQTVLRLLAHLPANGQIDFPVLADTISAKVQIVKMGKTDTLTDQSNPGIRTVSRQYVITSFDAGLHMIPAFTFVNKAVDVKTQPLPLEVTEIKVDTTKAIFDIKEPLAVSYSFMDWLRDNLKLVLFVALAILLIIGLIWYFIRLRKNRPAKPAPPKQVVPLHTITLAKLDALKQRQLWEQGQVKLYYSELTDIIREYLEKRYEISALEQTSAEIFAGLQQLHIPALHSDQLKQLLLLADLVKFAKAVPTNNDNQQSMENAVSFVEHTKPDPSADNKKQDPNEPV